MCGIYGMVSLAGRPLAHPGTMERMGVRLRHRGPDDHRILARPDAAMGAERLRITDPRPEAAQPFEDSAGAVWLACNGAVYNARSLRGRYPRYPYRSRSDIEPLLPLFLDIESGGVAEIDGMFAVAVWDARTRTLILARDRAGEKPLFYATIDGEVWFASEVAALLEHPALDRTLDPDATLDFLQLGYVREPHTMFAAVRKVPAGTVVVFSEVGVQSLRYWTPEQFRPDPAVTPLEAEHELLYLLERSVAKQLQADAPVGIFLSGGIDSSLVAALAVRHRDPADLPAFTVGFDEQSYDERGAAAAVAGDLRLPHVTVRVGDQDLFGMLDILTDRIAEPFADPAILPTMVLAQAARENVGVVLGGEGADELFGGYPTYVGHRAAPWFARLPDGVRRAMSRAAQGLPTSQAKVPLEFLVKRFLATATLPALERHLHWFGTGLDPAVFGAPARLPWPDLPDDGSDTVHRMMRLDYLTYLRDDLLPKVDRATMLHALEARAPFLDADLSAFAFRLPAELAVQGLTTKWLLKRAARRSLPAAAVHRRKRGLSVPVDRWLNGPLCDEANRLLAPDRLTQAGVLDAARVGDLVSEHRRGRANHARALWPLVVLQRWRERWVGD
jgi:asparagine synthase (glutamine-hydrolysing)